MRVIIPGPDVSCACRRTAPSFVRDADQGGTARRKSLQAADAARQNDAIRHEAVRRESLKAAQEAASELLCCRSGPRDKGRLRH